MLFKYIAVLTVAGFLVSCQSKNQTKEKLEKTETAVEKANLTLEEVFADSTYQLTGVAVSPDGRLFTNYPYWLEKHRYSVVEL